MRAWFVGLAALAACGPRPTVELGDIPGTATVSWSSNEGRARVVATRVDRPEVQSITPFGPMATEHEILTLGLEVGRDYEIRVEVDDGSGVTTSRPATVTVPPPPQGLPPFTVRTWDPERSCAPDAHVLFSVLSQRGSAVGIVNRDGRYVWGAVEANERRQIARPKPGRDGQSILWNTADSERVDDLGYIIRRSADGSETLETRTLWGHHDFVERPDGTMCWNSYEFNAELEIGDQIVPTAVDALVCGPEGATTTDDAEVLWSQFDEADWPLPFQVVDTEFLPGWNEYAHGNSLYYLEDDASFLLKLRWLDTLVKITADGASEWFLGGGANQFTVVQGDALTATGTEADLPREAHFSDAWYDADGNLQLLVFDNGIPPVDGGTVSRLVQYSIDETAMTVALDWEVPLDRYENLLGDVRRTGVEGCDNVMLSLSTQGRLVEMTRDGDVVWDIVSDFGRITTRLTLLPDLYDMSAVAY